MHPAIQAYGTYNNAAPVVYIVFAQNILSPIKCIFGKLPIRAHTRLKCFY